MVSGSISGTGREGTLQVMMSASGVTWSSPRRHLCATGDAGTVSATLRNLTVVPHSTES